MKALLLSTVCCLAFNQSLLGQFNYVDNPGFEDYISCPPGISSIGSDSMVFPHLDKWFIPAVGSSDYYHACSVASIWGVSVPENFTSDHLPPHSGDAYVGIFALTYFSYTFSEYREYVTTRLLDTIRAGDCVYAEFWVANSYKESNPEFNYTTDRIQICFTPSVIHEPTWYSALTDYTPQIENPFGAFFSDTATWTKVSGSFIATEDFAWVTIGNFKTDDSTSFLAMYDADPDPTYCSPYLLIDDVVVNVFLPTTFSDADTVVCEPIYLTIPDDAGDITWNTGDTSNTIYVDTTGYYWFTVTTPCNVYSDTIHVTILADGTVSSTSLIDVCSDDTPVVLSPAIAYDTYLWSTGETGNEIIVSEGGTYTLTGTSGCVIYTNTFLVTISDTSINLGNDMIACPGDFPLELNAGNGWDPYLWNTGDTTETIVIESTGIYFVTGGNACGVFSDTILITEDPFAGDTLVITGNEILCPASGVTEVILATDTGYPNYTWNTGEQTQSITVSSAGTYTLTVNFPCVTSYTEVTVEECNPVYIPNTFTPNNDGMNDFFFPYGPDLFAIKTFRIYDRWGELIYEANDISANDESQGWNGTCRGQQVMEGVYAYVIVMELLSGIELSENGNVTLLR
ncbi:MAG: gliding motility-associated C-terminal domain-containing protein [Chitinophagales bacterium]